MGFSLLRAIYHYKLTGFVCYIYLVYNLLIYDDLSIYVCFELLLDTPTEVYKMLFYFDPQQIPQFIRSRLFIIKKL